MLIKNCITCGKQIKVSEKEYVKGKGKYCSIKCYRGTKIEKKCLICGKTFLTWPCRIKKDFGKYCSWKCQYQSMDTSEQRKCKQCGEEFKIQKAQIKAGGGIFCCHECGGIWLISHQKRANTDIEIILKNWLISHKIKFIEQKNVEHVSFVDFFIFPNICLFADGDYWHNRSERQERDVYQTNKLFQLGYQVIRLKGSEILSGKRPIELLEARPTC